MPEKISTDVKMDTTALTQTEDYMSASFRKVAIGSDHGGAYLKEEVKKFLQLQGFEVTDFGGDPEVSTDYPDVAFKLAEAVSRGEFLFGVLLCGTGIGISIAANKVKGIRAALCFTSTHARLARAHNNANILVLGGRTTGREVALDIVRAFIEEKFEGGRHARRIGKILEYEFNKRDSIQDQ